MLNHDQALLERLRSLVSSHIQQRFFRRTSKLREAALKKAISKQKQILLYVHIIQVIDIRLHSPMKQASRPAVETRSPFAADRMTKILNLTRHLYFGVTEYAITDRRPPPGLQASSIEIFSGCRVCVTIALSQ